MARMMTLGDVMQATVLATLHLRSDLRTLGAFGALDSKSDSGGTPGDDLNLLIYLYRYMLMKANFRMVSFTSSHSAPRITCQRTSQAVSRQQTRITLSRGICTGPQLLLQSHEERDTLSGSWVLFGFPLYSATTAHCSASWDLQVHC